MIYAVATLVSSAFSLDPRASFSDDRQLLLFAIVPITYDLAPAVLVMANELKARRDAEQPPE